MFYHVGGSGHTQQNIQLNKVTGENEKCTFYFTKKTIQTFWPTQHFELKTGLEFVRERFLQSIRNPSESQSEPFQFMAIWVTAVRAARVPSPDLLGAWSLRTAPAQGEGAPVSARSTWAPTWRSSTAGPCTTTTAAR